MLHSVGNEIYNMNMNPKEHIFYANQDQETTTLYTQPNRGPPPTRTESEEGDTDSNSYLISEDPELQYGRTIITGDVEELKKILSKYNPNDEFIINEIQVEKIASHLKDQGIVYGLPKISPLNLALVSKQEPILDHLLDHGIEKMFNFSHYLLAHDFMDPATIFEKLVARNLEICQDLLHIRLDSNEDDPHLLSKRDTVLKIDLSLFKRRIPGSNRDHNELSPLMDMIRCGRSDLLLHPVTETFVQLKWGKVKWCFWLKFAYFLAFACSITLASLATFDETRLRPAQTELLFHPQSREVFQWITLALAVPFLMSTMLALGFQRLSFFISDWDQSMMVVSPPWKSSKRLLIPWPNLSWTALVEVALHVVVIGHLSSGIWHSPDFQAHCRVWSVFLAWIHVFNQIYRDPVWGIYPSLMYSVIRDVMGFFGLCLPLWLGLSFALHLSYGPVLRELAHPALAPLTLVSMTFGGFGSLHGMSRMNGTAHIVFLIFQVVVVIAMVNIFIGTTLRIMEKNLECREMFRICQMTLNVNQVEHYFNAVLSQINKCRVARKQTPLGHLLSVFPTHQESCIINVYPWDGHHGPHRSRKGALPLKPHQPRLSLPSLPLKALHSKELAVYWVSEPFHAAQPTSVTIPSRVWASAKPLIEQWHAKRRLREQETMANAETEADQRPYYWNPTGVSEKSEPYYEIVDDSASAKILRESHALLKELQRDVHRLQKHPSPVGSGANLGPSKPPPPQQHPRHRAPQSEPSRSSSHWNPLRKTNGDETSSEAPRATTVNVRPGVALGVITLSAGNKGPRITLH